MTAPLITRAEAWGLIQKQLKGDLPEDPKQKYAKNGMYVHTFHYGKCELRDLLDAIYGKFEEDG